AGEGLAIRVAQGRLTEVEEFENVILKTDAEGRVVRLKDVAPRIELGASGPPSYVSRNGKPVVALGLYAIPAAVPSEVSGRVRDALSRFRDNAPAGIDLDLAFDFSPNLEAPADPRTPDYLVLEVQAPDGASPERTFSILKRCEAILKDVKGVQDVLA